MYELQGNEFWLGMGYTLFWAVVLLLCSLPFALLHHYGWWRRRQQNSRFLEYRRLARTPEEFAAMVRGEYVPPELAERLLAPSSGPSRPSSPAALPPTPLGASSPPVAPTAVMEPAPPNPQRLTPAERRHTIVVGSEGDGKTQTQIAFLVGDITQGAQVVWASTNLSLFHSRDQQTDLRPIASLFEHTREPAEILAVLQWAADEVERRMQHYHQDEPHGHPIVIHVDELGGLYRAFGEALVTAMRTIAEQGRKVDIFLFLVAHNALKESTGLDAALKPLFKTRLLGNVDQSTWTALVGPGIKLRGIPDGQGLWHQPDKRGNVFEVRVKRPSSEEVTWLGRRRAPAWPSILEAAQPYVARIQQAAAQRRERRATTASMPLPMPWEPSALHQQVRELIAAAMPEIRQLMGDQGLTLAKAQELTQTSNRALARRLGLGDNGGSAAVRVRDLVAEWEQHGGVRLFDVVEPSDTSRTDRLERITPAA
jgi:hypothetical protein